MSYPWPRAAADDFNWKAHLLLQPQLSICIMKLPHIKYSYFGHENCQPAIQTARVGRESFAAAAAAIDVVAAGQ